MPAKTSEATAVAERDTEAAGAATATRAESPSMKPMSEPLTPLTPGEAAGEAHVTSQLSSTFRQRLSRNVARVAGSAGNTEAAKEEVATTEMPVDSAASSASGAHWHRHNPYATSPAQSLRFDEDGSPGSGSSPAALSGTLHSPPQVTVVQHSGGSARVSRTTSLVKPGDARVIRTTSLAKASDNAVLFSPQLGHSGSSLPSSARVSRTTSMVKGNESIVFPPQQLRFIPSQTSSARVSRTTSMVKGCNMSSSANNNNAIYANDSIPILSQPSMQPQQAPAISPLLRMSPHTSPHSVYSPPNFSTGERQHTPMQRQTSGSALQLPEACASEGGASGTAAYAHNFPFPFNASASGAMMPPYSRADLYLNEQLDFDGKYVDDVGGQQRARRMSNSQTHNSERPARTPEQHSVHRVYSSLDAVEEAALPRSTRPSPRGCVGSALPPSAQSAAREHVRDPRDRTVYTPQSDEQHLSRCREAGFGTSPVHSSPYTPQTGQGNLTFHQLPSSSPSAELIESADHFHESPTMAYVPEDEEREGKDAESTAAAHTHTDPSPNELGITQPPRPQRERAALPRSPPPSATKGQPPFTEAELTAVLEAAQASGETARPELWCPEGWQFSVYDAGMKAHYLIASEKVALTRGAIKYVSLFERYGNQTRFRFQLCNRYLNNRCTCGMECQYIHSHILSQSTQVHTNENSITASGVRQMNQAELAGGRNTLHYPTISAGMIFAVFPPNQLNSAPQLIPSEQILVTEGALQTYRALSGSVEDLKSTVPAPHYLPHSQKPSSSSASAAEAPIIRPRHCAHFQFKRMCNLGASCHFIHSLIPFVQGMVNQPPLPIPLHFNSLEDCSAGFVLPALPTSEARGDGTERHASAAMARVAAPLTSASLPPQPWVRLGSPFAADASMVPMGDSPSQMNAMLAASYAAGAAGAMNLSHARAMSSGSGSNTAIFTPEQAGVGYAGWGPGFPQTFAPFSVPAMGAMGAMPSFSVPAGYPQTPVGSQPQQVYMPDGMNGFRPVMQHPAQQPCVPYANGAMAPHPSTAAQQPWPPVAPQYF